MKKEQLLNKAKQFDFPVYSDDQVFRKALLNKWDCLLELIADIKIIMQNGADR